MTQPKYDLIDRKEPLPFCVKRWLLGGRGRHKLELLGFDLDLLWREHRTVIIARYARRYPGSRPSHWWDHREPRRRLGGTGQPLHECSAYSTTFRFGLPLYWQRAADVDCPTYLPRCVPIDPNDPPAFESEAAYLRRLKLLLPGEARRIPKDAYEPELVL